MIVRCSVVLMWRLKG